MTDQLVQAMLEEERQLLQRLDAVRAVIKAYGGDASAAHSVEKKVLGRNQRSRSLSGRTDRITSLVEDHLRGKSEPTPTREILSFLASKGIEITGNNPVTSLSALLSRAQEFEPVGRKGWLLKSRSPDVQASGAAHTSGAATPLIESQETSFPD